MTAHAAEPALAVRAAAGRHTHCGRLVAQNIGLLFDAARSWRSSSAVFQLGDSWLENGAVAPAFYRFDWHLLPGSVTCHLLDHLHTSIKTACLATW